MAINKRKIFRWIKIIILLYSIIGIALYYVQEKFLFHPEPLDTDHQFSFQQRFEEVSIALNNTDTLHMVKFYPADTSRKKLVIYFHGNMKNVERYAHLVKIFTAKGYQVWMPDYPGFGKSRGERTEKKLYAQALQVRKMAAPFSPDSIILYGKSFGTGIAAYTAANSNCRHLVLETPYYSIPDLFSIYAPIYPVKSMSNYQLPLFEYLQDARCPVTIFHGDEDGVIPYKSAKKLEKYLKSSDKFITVSGGKHNDLTTSSDYVKWMDSLLRY